MRSRSDYNIEAWALLVFYTMLVITMAIEVLRREIFAYSSIWGEEIVGFMTVGYQNLHLYLWEAMKLLIMPPANLLRSEIANHKGIVAKVLKCRHEINAKRKEVVKVPSVRITEFTRERERLEVFKAKLKNNIAGEK